MIVFLLLVIVMILLFGATAVLGAIGTVLGAVVSVLLLVFLVHLSPGEWAALLGLIALTAAGAVGFVFWRVKAGDRPPVQAAPQTTPPPAPPKVAEPVRPRFSGEKRLTISENDRQGHDRG